MLVKFAIGEQRAQRVLPRLQVHRPDHRLRQCVLVENRCDTARWPARATTNGVPILASTSPPASLAITGMPCSMASITVSPNPSYQSDGISRMRVRLRNSAIWRQLGSIAMFGCAASVVRSAAVVPQPGSDPEAVCREALRQRHEDRDSLHRARIDHGYEAAVEGRQVRKWSAAVNRRMNHHRLTARMLAYIRRRVLSDGHHAGRACDQFRGGRVGIPTGRTEREKLRRMRQINHAPRRRKMRLAQQRMPQIFRRYQHPVRLEFADVPAQHARQPRAVPGLRAPPHRVAPECADPRLPGPSARVWPRLQRARPPRCGRRARAPPCTPATADCCASLRRAAARRRRWRSTECASLSTALPRFPWPATRAPLRR